MVRQATAADLDQIADAYEEHFAFEENASGAGLHCVQARRLSNAARRRKSAGGWWAHCLRGRRTHSRERHHEPASSRPEYANVVWQRTLPAEAVRVIHLLMVRPSASGRGIGCAADALR